LPGCHSERSEEPPHWLLPLLLLLGSKRDSSDEVLPHMNIKIKRAYEAPTAADGTRIYAARDQEHNQAVVLQKLLQSK
jgi:hypothetical protein